MHTKIISVLIIVAMLFALVACGTQSKDKPEIANEISDTDISGQDDSTDSAEDEYYTNKVYYVGDDIPEGKYLINCTATDYSMDAIIFARAEDYENFLKSEKFTIGEFNKAVEEYAWANFSLEQDEKAYIGLKSGYVVLLDEGMCEFGKHDFSSSNSLYSGIYVVGEDTDNIEINIKCTSQYMQVTLFANREKYIEYHKAKRFTIGEESEAAEKYSDSIEYLNENDSASLNLRSGMVMIVEEGSGVYSIDKGPVIN